MNAGALLNTLGAAGRLTDEPQKAEQADTRVVERHINGKWVEVRLVRVGEQYVEAAREPESTFRLTREAALYQRFVDGEIDRALYLRLLREGQSANVKAAGATA
jgi:hypothetical protein